jgi:N utilization substance protein B
MNNSAKKSSARLAAVQALYQYESSKESAEDILQQFLEKRVDDLLDDDYSPTKPNKNMFKELFLNTIESLSEIDEIIKENLKEDRAVNDLEPVLKAIFRTGIYELKYYFKTPAKVVISEYVEITKAFFENEESGFVNFVFDNLAKKLRISEV